jgi:rubredoxin
MPNYICTVCGTQYPESTGYPVDICRICAEDRQYVREVGQEWTTLEDLRPTHHNEIRTLEPNLASPLCQHLLSASAPC